MSPEAIFFLINVLAFIGLIWLVKVAIAPYSEEKRRNQERHAINEKQKSEYLARERGQEAVESSSSKSSDVELQDEQGLGSSEKEQREVKEDERAKFKDTFSNRTPQVGKGEGFTDPSGGEPNLIYRKESSETRIAQNNLDSKLFDNFAKELKAEPKELEIHSAPPTGLTFPEKESAFCNFDIIDQSNFKQPTLHFEHNSMTPKFLPGNWVYGLAIDNHTLRSVPLIIDDNGKVKKWNTTYTDIGELMYKLKYYQNERSYITEERVRLVENCAQVVIDNMKETIQKCVGSSFKFDVILPVLPSKQRDFQPVPELAKAISIRSGIPIDFESLIKVKETEELKSVEDKERRAKMLRGKFAIKGNQLNRKNILIFDDLYRSGSTVKEITQTIKDYHPETNVFLLTITKTKSKR